MWATGCILAELITREPLFQGKTEGDQIFAIFSLLGTPSNREYEMLSRKVPFDPKLFKEFPYIPKNQADNNRLEKKFQCFSEKSLLCDLLAKLLSYVPEERLTARQALDHPFFNDIRAEYLRLDLS